jgi:chromosomal replication initiation ATPase DnaA
MKKDISTVKDAIDAAKKSGKAVGIAEDETLMEMAKIAGDLKSAIEKVIQAQIKMLKKKTFVKLLKLTIKLKLL